MHLEIFQYLDDWSVRRVSEVCKTFHNVTLRHEFKDSFKLYVAESYLAMDQGVGEAFETKKRTVRRYSCMMLGRVEFKSLAFAKNFFMRIGKDVTELYIRTIFFYPLMVTKGTERTEIQLRSQLLKNFPNLKKLVVEDQKVLDTLSFYSPSLNEVYVQDVLMNHTMFSTDYADLLPKKGATGLKKLTVRNALYPCTCLLNVDRPNKLQQFSDAVFQFIDEIADLEHFAGIETDCNILDHKQVFSCF